MTTGATPRGTRRRRYLALAFVVALIIGALLLVRREKSVQHAFGYSGGVLLGTHLAVDGVRPNNERFDLSTGEEPAELTIDLRLSKGECDFPASDLPCGSAESKIRLRLSSLLDFRDDVRFGSGRAATFQTSGLSGSRRFSLKLPELSTGRHCLLVSVLEDPSDVIATPSTQHGSVTVFELVVANPVPDYCFTQSTSSVGEQLDLATPLGCEPVLSVREDEPFLRRVVKSGTPVWAFIPKCSDKTVFALTRNGFILEDSPDRASMVAEGIKEPGMKIELSQLKPAIWNLVIAYETPQRIVASFSQPTRVQSG